VLDVESEAGVARGDPRGLAGAHGETIDARRACEWGLVEEIGGDDALDRVVNLLLANDAKRRRSRRRSGKASSSSPRAKIGVRALFPGREAEGNRALTPILLSCAMTDSVI